MIENNENKYLCKNCGGKCCKMYGGSFHPSDFGVCIDYTSIKRLLTERDDISIDCLDDPDDGRINGYFLRMRHRNGSIVDFSWGGACVHLTQNGCDLPFDERPYGCKILVPGKCHDPNESGYDKYKAYDDWKEYWEILDKLKREYYGGLLNEY